jgi:hypothetical protein
MSKLTSAEDVIALIKSGKYASRVNAQRGAGRTRLSDGEKKKVFAFITSYFPEDGEAPKAAKATKKVAKKAAKKAAAAAAGTQAKPGKKAAKKAAKKATRQARATASPTTEAQTEEATVPLGTLPISPSEVSTVSDVLRLIDSTVLKSVSIMNALEKVRGLSAEADITEGVANIKQALTGAAQMLNQSVIVPLYKAGAKADPETVGRLEQVVAAAQAAPQQILPPPQNHVASEVPMYSPPPPPEHSSFA